MSIYTLGLAGAVGHDPAAALFKDQQLVAAVEEERMLRRKHASSEAPYHAARQCFEIAGIRPSKISRVAIPFAPINLFNKARWHYAYRHWYAPDRAVDGVLNGNRRYRRYLKDLNELLVKLHIDPQQVELVPVQHQIAHASSCYHINESDEKTAILCLDSKGEYSNIFLGYGENGEIVRIKEFYNPDSLCGMYAALTDYLGFEILDGEFKVMGIAPFGDPEKYDLSSLAKFNGKKFKVDNTLIGTVGLRRYKAKSKGHYFSKKLVEMLGPRRVGNLTDDPYVHYAASIQKLYEDLTVEIVEHFLGDILDETGRLAISGTGSMNIRLNRRLQALPRVKKLIVHPACSDSGTAIGAAAYAVRNQSKGEKLEPVKSMYLGPEYSEAQCIQACKTNREKPVWERLDDPNVKAVELLAKGEIVAWFQGRMEFGPRSLGNRSILANPEAAEVSEKLNHQVKFREKWRPYSASVLDSLSDELVDGGSSDKYMCISQDASEKWKEKYPSIMHVDGTCRVQIVDGESSPELHQLLTLFQEKTGHGMLINATLNRPGEALVCSPGDAVNMFLGTDLNYLILGNLLVTRRDEPESW
jgi:carbamoyltransferase